MIHGRLVSIIILCIIGLCAPAAHGQDFNTWGTGFWLAFLSNNADNDHDTYKIAIVGPRACSVTISNPTGTWSQVLSVSPNQVTEYTVPETQCWQAGSYLIHDRGLYINATDQIQVFAFCKSGLAGAADATIVLPFQSLGSEYVVQTYPVNTANTNTHGLLSILATMDNTVVDIYPTAHYLQGTSGTGNRTHIAVNLNAGQVFQLETSNQDGTQDFSGTYVVAQNCRPIAVFSGATLARVPLTASANDHLFAQNIPMSSWGDEWILTPAVGHEHDYCRVTAKDDSTYVYVDGTQRTMLNARQTYEFGFTTPMHLTTSKPTGVFQYLISRISSAQGSDHGDCSMFAPNPLGQKQSATTFSIFDVDSRAPSVSEYYVNVVVPTSETTLTLLDNSPIADFAAVGATGYSYARCPIGNGTHSLRSNGSGFVAHTYGLGENWESYIMSLGGNDTSVHYHGIPGDTIDTTVCNLLYFRNSTYTESGTYFIGNPCDGGTMLNLTVLHSPNTSFDITMCGDTYTWRGQEYTQPGHYSDSVPVPNGCDSVYNLNLRFVHQIRNTEDTSVCADYYLWHGLPYTETGIYHDTVNIAPGCDSILTLNLTMEHELREYYDTVLCGNTYIWQDEEYHQSGIYRDTLNMRPGCDSILQLNLVLNPVYDITIDTSFCAQGVAWEGDSITRSGLYTYPHQTVQGCDSTIRLDVTLYPTYDTLYYVIISDTASYTWINGRTYTTATDTAIRYDNQWGCDSIVRLHLETEPVIHAPLIWIPNVFTPNNADNNLFRIYSQNVDQMTVYIFRRQGDLVSTFDGLTESWDGTHNGTPCPQATYVYRITYRNTGNNVVPEPINGTVTLIR